MERFIIFRGNPWVRTLFSYLALASSVTVLASPGSHCSCGDLSPPCFLRSGFRGSDPSLLGASVAGIPKCSCALACILLGHCFQLPLGLHRGLLLPISNRRAPLPVDVKGNCSKLSCDSLSHSECGECGFPVLEHVQIIEARLLWNKVMG